MHVGCSVFKIHVHVQYLITAILLFFFSSLPPSLSLSLSYSPSPPLSLYLPPPSLSCLSFPSLLPLSPSPHLSQLKPLMRDNYCLGWLITTIIHSLVLQSEMTRDYNIQSWMFNDCSLHRFKIVTCIMYCTCTMIKNEYDKLIIH